MIISRFPYSLKEMKKVYGFQLDMTQTSPESMITYFGENASYTPARMGSSSFSYGSWADVWFIKLLRPCMLKFDGTVAYDLDKNNYAYKAAGGESDYNNESFDGNAMLGVPLIWVKIDATDILRPKFYFCMMRLDSDYNAWAHMDANGNIMHYTYMPIYDGYVDSNGRLRSLSGKPMTDSLTIEVFREKARNNNIDNADIWDMETIADHQLIMMLSWLISKTTDSQSVFGWGASGLSIHLTNTGGIADDKGLFWGDLTNRTNPVKMFGMENLYANSWKWKLGLLANNGIIMVKLVKGKQDGTTVDDFNFTSDGYLTIGAGSTGGYTTQMWVNEKGLYPKANGGSSSTYFCDVTYLTTSNVRTGCIGGNCGCQEEGGISDFGITGALSRANTYFTAKCTCKPLVH